MVNVCKRYNLVALTSDKIAPQNQRNVKGKMAPMKIEEAQVLADGRLAQHKMTHPMKKY